uniref:Uncharacterized protein n=1 Tax=Panagrolaimus sp. ES5 TaxID=591445 RepID=A0AC34F0C4_9BILA
MISTTVPVISTDIDEPNNITTVYKTADILIGMDYFFDFVTSFEKLCDDNYIVNSTVGIMICKKVQLCQNNTVSSMVIQLNKETGCINSVTTETGVIRYSNSFINSQIINFVKKDTTASDVILKSKAKNTYLSKIKPGIINQQLSERIVIDERISPNLIKITPAKRSPANEKAAYCDRGSLQSLLAKNDIHRKLPRTFYNSKVQPKFQRCSKSFQLSTLTTASAVNENLLHQRTYVPKKFHKQDFSTNVCGGERLAVQSKESKNSLMKRNCIVSFPKEKDKLLRPLKVKYKSGYPTTSKESSLSKKEDTKDQESALGLGQLPIK